MNNVKDICFISWLTAEAIAAGDTCYITKEDNEIIDPMAWYNSTTVNDFRVTKGSISSLTVEALSEDLNIMTIKKEGWKPDYGLYVPAGQNAKTELTGYKKFQICAPAGTEIRWYVDMF